MVSYFHEFSISKKYFWEKTKLINKKVKTFNFSYVVFNDLEQPFLIIH